MKLNTHKLSYWVLGSMVLIYLIFSAFNHLADLALVPTIKPFCFLSQTPNLIVSNFIIQQPSSTVIVFLLAFVTIYLGYKLLNKQHMPSFWLGIGFIFWGLGAFMAGISYQAFGYYLKCVGYDTCRFTDHFELIYMSLTVISLSAIMLAYASMVKNQVYQKYLTLFAFGSALLYAIIQGIGMVVPVQFLVSYEGLLVFLAPNLIIFMIISYKKRKELLHKRLFTMWLWFIGVNIAYFVALFASFTWPLYESTGIWFNENDVLHVLLIIWMIALLVWIKPVLDKTQSDS
ncbi:MAG: hypothetical protein WCI62_02740 [Erysipelotrichaceae bacterium]